MLVNLTSIFTLSNNSVRKLANKSFNVLFQMLQGVSGNIYYSKNAPKLSIAVMLRLQIRVKIRVVLSR